MDPNFEPIERVTVSEEIIKQVINLINTGKLKPGSKLPSERELMERFRVSRSSVREALHSLTMIGLLETRPGDGTYVSIQMVDIIGGQLEWSLLLGNRELLELMEVREPLEIQAAGLAARRATPELIQKFRQAIETYKAAGKNTIEQMDGELVIHMTIAQMSGNRTLSRIIQTFQELLRDYRTQKKVAFASYPSTGDEYNDILMAIRDGDEELARQMMTQHLQMSKSLALVVKINEHTEHLEKTVGRNQTIETG